MNKRVIIGLGILIVLTVGWYLFRPELIFVNKTVNEALPENAAMSGGPVLLTSGMFHKVAHDSMGTASIYQLADGKRTLRLTNFETSNGPQVHIYLVAAQDANDNDTVKNAPFIDLGSMKGNKGDQNYDVPANTDLNQYRAVTIWCQRFGVNFGTAPLAESMTKAAGTTILLASGNFHAVAHESAGMATIYQLANGQRTLRLTNFQTSNGPDVHIYLVAAPDASDDDTVKRAGFIDLGSLKGNQGDQNYAVPASVDLNQYQTVTIWCKRFGVNFGTAPLQAKS